MIYKNVLLHNVAEIIDNDDGSFSWKRVPSDVHKAMESPHSDNVVHNSTGVEMRFVINGENAVIKMSTYDAEPDSSGVFHIYRGSLQGGWEDHELHKIAVNRVEEFVIPKSKNIEHLKVMSEQCGCPWDPEVIRIIFDRGRFKIFDIIGDIAPPERRQCPSKTLLAYGSSITHGSNSIDMSHSWVSLLAHNLNMDALNLGCAGSCYLEPKMADYIADEGQKGNWDAAVLELGINVLGWNEDKIYERVNYMLDTITAKNKDKYIFVISPFYYCGEYFNDGDNAKRWRISIEKCVKRLNNNKVIYINGFEILDGMKYISADEVHPNIYGVQRIADMLTVKIKSFLI